MHRNRGLQLLCVAVGLSAPAPVAAQLALRGLPDSTELGAFVDSLMETALTDDHLAGGAIAVVKDGAVFLTRGYGYADIETRRRVSPDSTLFRIASVSKLFTWTAVMQLVEQGKLDLGADVNRYLDFTIPPTYARPITFWNLLTYTSGFEEDGRDLMTTEPADTVPLGRWLAARRPARVRPPGSYASYINYSAALAGYIVARTSGMGWDEYVERRILDPLGMRRTTSRQPLPTDLAGDMSRGYDFSEGVFKSRPWEILTGAAPAGSITSTAADMARFMLAHLGHGSLAGERILLPATVDRMQARAFGHDPRLPGITLGFHERMSRGMRIIGHGGHTRWFQGEIALIPSENVGVFVVFNTGRANGPSALRLIRAVLDRYYPLPRPALWFPAQAQEQATRVAGEYLSNRRSYTTFQRAAGLFNSTNVEALGDGSLMIQSEFLRTRLLPVGPLLYRDATGRELVAFQSDGSGRITHAFIGSMPYLGLDRLPWNRSPRLHRFVLGLAIIVFLGTVLKAGAQSLRRLRVAVPSGERAPGQRLLLGLALINLLFVFTLPLILADGRALGSGPVPVLRLALALPLLGGALTLGAAMAAASRWRQSLGTTASRVGYTAAVVIAALFLWSLSQWNLLGWRM